MQIHPGILVVPLAIMDRSEIRGELDQRVPGHSRLSCVSLPIKMPQAEGKKPPDGDHRMLALVHIWNGFAKEPHAVMVQLGVVEKAKNLIDSFKAADDTYKTFRTLDDLTAGSLLDLRSVCADGDFVSSGAQTPTGVADDHLALAAERRGQSGRVCQGRLRACPGDSPRPFGWLRKMSTSHGLYVIQNDLSYSRRQLLNIAG